MLHSTKTILTAILLILLTATTVHGQYYTLGNDPARARWRTISSKHYRLIYPEETDSIARLYLYTLEKVRPAVMSQLEIDPRPVPVILHPYTTQSNGVVSWAPKRMELFTSPDPYNSNPDSWITHLSIHESRHVGQIEHFTKGIYRVFYYLLGEQVTGLGLGLFANTYAMEGDAVIAETELTEGGRGRNADFTKYLRAMYINGDYRNWDRLQFGSFRYYTPNEYVFGYALGSYARYISGMANYIGQYFSIPIKKWYDIPLNLDPSRAITGESKYRTLVRSQHMLGQMWRYDYQSRGQYTASTDLTAKKDRLYTEFTDPILIADPSSPWYGSIIAVKEGMETVPKLVSIDSTGRERFIRFFPYTHSRLTYDGKHRIYWTEPVSNEASTLEDFSTVMVFDTRNGKVKSLKHRTKYFNPAPSSTGDTIAVAEYPIGRTTCLTLLDASTHEPIYSIQAPEGGQIREQVFDGKDIYCSVIQEDGIGIYRLSGGRWTEVTAPQRQSISGLRLHGRDLYFSSDLNGVVNIYRYSLEGTGGGHPVRITNSAYGADYPYFDPSSDSLYYCEYSLDGYRPVVSSPDQLTEVREDFSKPFRYPLAEFLSAQTDSAYTPSPEDTADRAILDPGQYPSRRYSKLLHSIHIHSWFPVYVNLDRLMSFTFDNFTQTASLGATLLSQNNLGNIISTAAYGYVRDPFTDRYFHSGHFNLDARIFGNLSVEAGLDVNERNAMDYIYDTGQATQIIAERAGKPLISPYATVYMPIDFNSKGWYRSLTPYVSWTFNNDRYYTTDGQTILGTSVTPHQMQYGISYTQTLPTATAQIYPRWGFGISLQGISFIGAGNYFGNTAYLSGYAYMPGFTRQQGLRLGLKAQKQFVDGKMFLTSMNSLPRGYTGYCFDETYGSVSLDYAIPIYLGDFSLGSILYFKRLQLIPFGDYGLGMAHRNTALTQYYSFGTDIKVDFIALRFNFPLSIGMRYAHTGPQARPQDYFGLLFEVSLN